MTCVGAISQGLKFTESRFENALIETQDRANNFTNCFYSCLKYIMQFLAKEYNANSIQRLFRHLKALSSIFFYVTHYNPMPTGKINKKRGKCCAYFLYFCEMSHAH